MKNKEEIIIYWAPFFQEDPAIPLAKDWNMLYKEPENVFDDLIKNKNQLSGRSSMFNCPAVKDRMTTSFVFKNNLKTTIEYDFTDETKPHIKSLEGVNSYYHKASNLKDGSNIAMSLQWIFFSEETVTALINPAFYHPPTQLTKEGMFPYGKVDISGWIRPLAAEIQLYNTSGKLIIEENDPLFYLELLTDKKIILKRFEVNHNIYKYVMACSNSVNNYGKNVPLVNRYKRFFETKTNSLVLKEIKNNLVA